MLAYALLYTTAVGAPLALAAWALAAVLRRSGRAERGVWLVALGLAIALPLVTLSASRNSTVAPAESPATGVIGLPELIAVSGEAAPVRAESYIIALWALLSGALALRWAWGAFQLRLASRTWTPGTIDGVAVHVTDDIGPAVAGIFQPRILAPAWVTTLPESKRALVLMHEQEHVHARDPLVVALARVARVLVPWNPVVLWLSSRLIRAIELDCDRRVLRTSCDVRVYGTTLLDISARRPGRLVAAAAFAESEAPLRSRILAMTTPPRSVSVAAVFASVVLGVVLLVGALEIPVPAIRIQVEIGGAPPAPERTVTRASFQPSSTRPRLVNEAEVQQVAQSELERVQSGFVIQSQASGPTNILMPKFTPMSVHPALLNREEVGGALSRAYSRELRDAGIGGTTTLMLRVGPDGSVTNVRVEGSSGHESLDEAAIGVATVARFEPARNRDQRVPVWVSLPVTFAANP